MRLLSIAVLLNVFGAFAQTTLSGTIAGTTYEASGNPFIVTDNLTIPEGKSVTIRSGCVFLFKPFTGMIVDGSLIVKGTQENPVVFSTVNDGKYDPKAEALPNPFDWNGIHITPKAGHVSLSNIVVAYTVYGIKSMKEDFFIENGIFNQNGQYHLTVNEKIMQVADGMPYDYGTKAKSNRGGEPFVRKHLPAILGTIGAACGLGTVLSAIVFLVVRNDYLAEADPAKQKDSRAAMTNTLVSSAVFATATAALVPTAIIIHNKRKKSSIKKTTLEVYPQYKDGPAIAVRIRF